MKKITKTLFALLLVAGSLMGTACNGGAASSEESSSSKSGSGEIVPFVPEAEPKEEKEVVVEKIYLDTYFMSLFLQYNDADELVSESQQLVVSFLPHASSTPKFVFASSDDKVATVDENGVVTSVGVGKAEISVSSPDGKVKEVCQVTVSIGDLRISRANSIGSGIGKKQGTTTHYDKVHFYETFTSGTQKGDETYLLSKSNAEITISKEDAYFKMESYDYDAKVGENLSASYGSWIMYTDELFYTHMFHITGSKKTYMCLSSTTIFTETGNRFEGLGSVLDNFFTSGRSIVTNILDGVLGKDCQSIQSGTFVIGGSNDTYDLAYRTHSQGNQTVKDTDESDIYVPTGTVLNVVRDEAALFEDCRCVGTASSQHLYYTDPKGLECDRYSISSDYYDIENIELDYPTISDFKEVDSLFDL